MQIQQASILVVDDNDSMRRLMLLLLRDLHAREILQAATVNDAFDVLEHHNVDAIITDWEMQGESGLELLRRLRTSGNGNIRRLPVVVMTAHAESWRVSTARDAGASEFLVKPLSPAQLAAKLRGALRRSRLFIRNENFTGPDRRRSQRPFPGTDRRRATPPTDNAAETVSPQQLADALATLKSLRMDFEVQLGDAAERIRQDARNLRARPEVAAEIADRIFRVAHDIKGQGTSLDYPLASEIAAELCKFIRQGPAISQHHADVINGFATALSTVARHKVTGSGGDLGQKILDRLRIFSAA